MTTKTVRSDEPQRRSHGISAGARRARQSVSDLDGKFNANTNGNTGVTGSRG